MKVLKQDKEILQVLGRRLRDISDDPANAERIERWTAVNDLKRVRPPVHIMKAEVPWSEMDVNDELVLRCENKFVQGIEQRLRRKIYAWNHMSADEVVEGLVECPLAISDSGFGINEDVDIVGTDPNNPVVSRHFNIQIKDEKDIQKIHFPEVFHNEKESEERFEALNEIFEGILPVRKAGIKISSISAWDFIIRLTGIEEILMDLYERPDYVHKLIDHLTNAYLHQFEQFEQMGLLSLNNDSSRTGGGLNYTSDLPKPGRVNRPAMRSEMWGRSMAQIFTSVSPAMHDEFAIQYEKKFMKDFGLSYYGCCEPMHRKIGILKQISNLRKISMSPWVDHAEGAEVIGMDYAYSLKPNPAILAEDTWRPEQARADLRDALEKTRGCPVEIVMKDISTVHKEPQRLWAWAKIAVEEAERVA